MYHGLYNIGTMTIGAEASLKLESGLINEREGHITNNGRLETAGYTYLTAPSLIENNGEWILNGNVDSQDTEWGYCSHQSWRKRYNKRRWRYYCV